MDRPPRKVDEGLTRRAISPRDRRWPRENARCGRIRNCVLPLRHWFHSFFSRPPHAAGNNKLRVATYRAGLAAKGTDMFRVFTCLTGEHDLRLVALAGAICFLASF